MSEFEPKWKSEAADYLAAALTALQTQDECLRLLDDLCTVSELEALAQRLEVARLLTESQTYSQISEITGASTATISRVKRCLNYGPGGYRLVLDRLLNRGKQQ
ncbi:MAG: YerC/YecD family TrpR-related protein [Solirubrobacterales bacterium]